MAHFPHTRTQQEKPPAMRTSVQPVPSKQHSLSKHLLPKPGETPVRVRGLPPKHTQSHLGTLCCPALQAPAHSPASPLAHAGPHLCHGRAICPQNPLKGWDRHNTATTTSGCLNLKPVKLNKTYNSDLRDTSLFLSLKSHRWLVAALEADLEHSIVTD